MATTHKRNAPLTERPSKRLKANAGAVLPPDAIWEILLRVPAKALGSCRAACRSWRSLLSDPSFIRAYAGRGAGLILVANEAGDRVSMVNLSGEVVQRMRIPSEDVGVPHKSTGPLYLLRSNNRVRVVEPDTGAVATLPFDDPDEPTRRPSWEETACYALGLVSSTGQRKVLRLITHGGDLVEQRCHVLTLGDDGQQRWRKRPSPPIRVTANDGFHSVVIQGVVYFMADQHCPRYDINDCVASFDLETEEWRPTTLPGPRSIDTKHCVLRLAKLNRTLAIVHSAYPRRATADLWFAKDLEKGIWVKEPHSTQQNLLLLQLLVHQHVELLEVLEDGRVIFLQIRAWVSKPGEYRIKPEESGIRIYDPKTNQYCGCAGEYWRR